MFTKDEIELLNRPAKNFTRARVVEGMDWDHWHYFPGRGNEPGRFTDGHDYAGTDPSPYDGWELLGPVTLEPEAVAKLLRELANVERNLGQISRPKRQAERQVAAAATRSYLRDLIRLFAAPNKPE